MPEIAGKIYQGDDEIGDVKVPCSRSGSRIKGNLSIRKYCDINII
jgi:hypothetical protein